MITIGLQRLEGFYWVARTGGFTKAAKALPYPVTEPAVHQQVRKLERELGSALFERVGRDRMALTPAGKALFDFVAPFLEKLPEEIRSIREGNHGGVLRIFAENLFIREMIPAWIRRIQKLDPKIRVELRAAPALDSELLLRGEADLLLGYLPQASAGIDTQTVATLRSFWVFPTKHFGRRPSLSPPKLQKETFIAYSPELLAHALQMKALANHGVAPERMLTVGSAEAILGFVEAGLGYSLIPHLSKAGPQSRGIFSIPLQASEGSFPVTLAWKSRTPIPPIVARAITSASSRSRTPLNKQSK